MGDTNVRPPPPKIANASFVSAIEFYITVYILVYYSFSNKILPNFSWYEQVVQVGEVDFEVLGFLRTRLVRLPPVVVH